MAGWSRKDVAERAGIHERTVIDFEREARSPIPVTLSAIRMAFEKAGLAVLDANGEGEGVRWAKPPESR